jgi:TorA maturation chaperone TorD
LQSARISLQRRIDPEDQARAEFYAVLARLFGGPPDAGLLRSLGAAERLPGDEVHPVAAAWNRLLDASAAMDPDAAAQEYTDLFIGVGRCEVDLHAAHWRTASTPEKPLVELRSELPTLGLSRLGHATVLEDHLSALCETMRLLIAGDGERAPAELDVQRNFSRKWLFPWVFTCCAAIEKSSIANYYARVAEFSTLFMALERDSLAME